MDVDVLPAEVRQKTGFGLRVEATSVEGAQARVAGVSVSAGQAGDTMVAGAVAAFRGRATDCMSRTVVSLNNLAGKVDGAMGVYQDTDTNAAHGFDGVAAVQGRA